MKIILFDLCNRDSLAELSQKLRAQSNIVHDVIASINDLPNGAYGAIDRIWYQATVATKLADMFSGKMIEPDTEFIFDTTLTFLNTSVTILSNEQGITTTVTDFRDLL